MVHVLPADALALMAHELAARIHGGHFPRGHLDHVALPPVEGAVPKESASSGLYPIVIRSRPGPSCRPIGPLWLAQ